MGLVTGEATPRSGSPLSGFGPAAALFALALVAAVGLAYLPVFSAGFVWDDDLHLLNNPVLKEHGLYRIWVAREAIVFWPVAFTSYWLEHQLWGLDPSGYHAVNVALHALSALLFGRILLELRFEARVAALAALLFALHPQNVESVAWIAQRKNLLAMLFFLLSVHGYLRFDRHGDAQGSGGVARWLWYAWALVALALGLLAKGSIAPQPFVLLLALAWRRGLGLGAADAGADAPWRRPIGPRDLVWIAPFLLVSFGLTLQEVLVQIGAIGGEERGRSFLGTLVAAGFRSWFYVWKSILPTGLGFVYPRFAHDPGQPGDWIPTLGALASLLAAVWLWRRGGRCWREGRAASFALAYYALMIAPALGFADFYYLRYAPVADHYQYYAQLGLVTVVAALWARLAVRPWVFALGAGVVLLLLGAATQRHSRSYADEETLWRSALAVNPDASLAHNNLGRLLAGRGEHAAALPHFLRATETDPGNREAWLNAGRILETQGESDRALRCYRQALQRWPGESGGEAVLQALPLPEAHVRLGLLVSRQNDVAAAAFHYQQALRLAPQSAAARVGLANTLLVRGEVQRAITLYQQATQLAPEAPEAFGRLTLLYASYPMRTLRDARRAVELGEHAAQITGRRDAAILDALAAAYAEAGRFDDALETSAEAAALAVGAGHERFAAQIESRRAAYARGEPHRLERLRLGWGMDAGYSGDAP